MLIATISKLQSREKVEKSLCISKNNYTYLSWQKYIKKYTHVKAFLKNAGIYYTMLSLPPRRYMYNHVNFITKLVTRDTLVIFLKTLVRFLFGIKKKGHSLKYLKISINNLITFSSFIYVHSKLVFHN